MFLLFVSRLRFSLHFVSMSCLFDVPVFLIEVFLVLFHPLATVWHAGHLGTGTAAEKFLRKPHEENFSQGVREEE